MGSTGEASYLKIVDFGTHGGMTVARRRLRFHGRGQHVDVLADY